MLDAHNINVLDVCECVMRACTHCLSANRLESIDDRKGCIHKDAHGKILNGCHNEKSKIELEKGHIASTRPD